MHDLLRETPIYQEILKEGREEGRQEALEILSQAVVQIVRERFPRLERLAKKRIAFEKDIMALQRLLVATSIAQNTEEAGEYLLTFDDDDADQPAL